MTQRKWGMKLAIVAALVFIGWVLVVSSKQIERNRRIQTEVAALEAEAAKIRRENETLTEKIRYFASDAFREQEAKSKLGLKKMEETVILIKSSAETAVVQSIDNIDADQAADESREKERIPKYKKWWRLFFQ